MAKSIGFRSRFPHAGLFLVIAVALAIPLTVFSLNKVDTNTQQHAAGYTCSSSNPGGTCPTGQGCAYDSSFGMYTCEYKVSAPTGLVAYSSYCKTGGVEYDTINFNWNAVSHASKYILYHRIYSSDNRYTYSSKTVTDNMYLYSTKSLNGRRVQWYVVAANTWFSAKSVTLTTPAAFVSCPN